MSKHTLTVMPGLGPGIHVLYLHVKSWMAGIGERSDAVLVNASARQ